MMSKSRCFLALVFLGPIALVPMTSWANASICDGIPGNLVKNCGFERAPATAPDEGRGDFLDWTVKFAASGSLLLVMPAPVFAAHSGNFSAYFAAQGPFDDSISQVLSTTAGRAFRLSFFLENAGLPPSLEKGETADFRASWDGKTVFALGTIPEFPPQFLTPYTQFSFVVPGTGHDTLQFAGRNKPGVWGLDDIVVTPITRAVVPEPSTLSLFGLGLLLGGALLARKKKLLNRAQA